MHSAIGASQIAQMQTTTNILGGTSNRGEVDVAREIKAQPLGTP